MSGAGSRERAREKWLKILKARKLAARSQARDRASFAVSQQVCSDSRVADRIDGYDRDDLGQSPDY